MLIHLEQQLGPLCYPLLLCSLTAAMILLERLAVLSTHSLRDSLQQQSLALLARHREQPRAMREEIVGLWLQRRRRQLASGIRLLQIIAMLSPLLGLLGTVIGLIQVFDTLGEHRGPVEPALLAQGLGVAMKTTAAGLIIAVPALLGAHGFQLWVDKLAAAAEQLVNVDNLRLDGICTEAFESGKTQFTEARV